MLTVTTMAGDKPTAAGVGLMGVDSTLAQLAPLLGPDEWGRVTVRATSDRPAFDAFDPKALTLGQVRGDNAAKAAVLRISQLPMDYAGDEAVYAATKFAQVGLAGGLDRELRAKNIRVATICPGGTATEFAMGFGRTPDMPGLDDMMRPENIADAIVTVLQQPKSMRTLIWSMRSIEEQD